MTESYVAYPSLLPSYRGATPLSLQPLVTPYFVLQKSHPGYANAFTFVYLGNWTDVESITVMYQGISCRWRQWLRAFSPSVVSLVYMDDIVADADSNIDVFADDCALKR